jgi:hypothetical protein
VRGGGAQEEVAAGLGIGDGNHVGAMKRRRLQRRRLRRFESLPENKTQERKGEAFYNLGCIDEYESGHLTFFELPISLWSLTPFSRLLFH